MTREIEIEISEKQILLSDNKSGFYTSKDTLVILNEYKSPISLGAYNTLIDFKQDTIELYSKATDENLKEISKNMRVTFEYLVNNRSICQSDLSNGTDLFWKEEGKKYSTINPVNTTEFDSNIIYKFLLLMIQEYNREIKAKLFEKYKYNIIFPNYEKLDETQKKSFNVQVMRRLPKNKRVVLRTK